MMGSFFEKFVNQIQIENYIKNIKNRKIVIWGAGEDGKVLHKILLNKKQSVYAFVDKKACKSDFEFNGIKVEAPEFLMKNKGEFYVFVAANFYEEIELFLNNNGYFEIHDYLYILHKPIEIEKNEEYIDKYGNIIKGSKGTKIKFIAYNSVLNIGVDCVLEEKNSIYCVNSNISIGAGSNLGRNTKITSINSSISIGSNCKLGINGSIDCTNNSDIKIGDDCFFGERYIMCLNNGIINIGTECYFEEKCHIDCNDNSNIHIGNQCNFGEKYLACCVNDSILNIGKGSTFGESFFLFSYYGGVVKIGNDCMVSLYVTVGNNDGHPVFDINTGVQFNKNNDIIIGNHVWLGNKCTIISGSDIGDGSIIGANSLVNKKFPNNCTIAGNPANLKRKDIAWDRSETNIDLINKKLYWNKTIK
ncbi:hypothetical protein [Clostridium beijerinckii]|uniref:hypothetical protein n=1 Tax=Clostridium beijerinckii TaxID=1520 RepID=UPI000687F510|nr:hypothetical protein [Clostridium beijerinckii]